LEGIRRHKVTYGRVLSDVAWQTLCEVSPSDAIAIPGDPDLDLLEDRELSDYLESERLTQPIHDSAKEVGEIDAFNFDSFVYMDAPSDLFKR
jgi:hypothetical protein